MAYEVIILGHLHMPLYFLGTFTEYPYLIDCYTDYYICALFVLLVSRSASYKFSLILS